MRVVVTGASRGIGLELVRQHARRGDRVLATCRRPEAAAALRALAAAHPGLVEVARLDVTDPEQISAAARAAEGTLGAVDLLWSNAGVYPGCPGTPVEEGPLGTLRAGDGLSVLAVNAVGAVLLAQGFLPLLRRGERPRLVALSSGYASLELNQGTPYWYGASKAALNMLHRSLAADPAARGVVVLLLSPGWVATDMGGPDAPTPVEESVAGMIRVADAAGPDRSGAFLDWRGHRVPW
ncbi:MAG TPA: SDR family oxidoreductase [Anaeromyxobacteraceae bacterium]|nr:SDR family oxidoreductase [Anaeromyxobacteraceae bacterium]